MLSSTSLEKTASSYYENRIINNKITPKVYDISHLYLPNLYKYYDIHNLITVIFMIPLLFNFNMLQEYLSYWIVIFIFRSITTRVTILPKYKECKVNNDMQIDGGCYDKIFSGHFASVFLATLLYLKYNWINLPVLILINFINSISILTTRSHYTIDLIVALIFTLFVYQNNLRIK
jgi:hypothetical protein